MLAVAVVVWKATVPQAKEELVVAEQVLLIMFFPQLLELPIQAVEAVQGMLLQMVQQVGQVL
jgi:hypothetical protein